MGEGPVGVRVTGLERGESCRGGGGEFHVRLGYFVRETPDDLDLEIALGSFSLLKVC